MKKALALILCTILVFSFAVSASASTITAVPTLNAGEGENNTFFATVSLSKKDGYYSSVSCTLFGRYRYHESSGEYTTSRSASNTSAYISKPISATARVYPSRIEDTPLSFTVQNVQGYYRK